MQEKLENICNLPKTAIEMISSAFFMSSKAKSAVEDAAIL